MKILSKTFKRKINASASVCLWNHWDQDHLNYCHKRVYTESKIFYEDERVVFFWHELKVPFVPFIIRTLDFQTLKGKNTVCTYGFQFGIPSLTTAEYKDIAKDKCQVKVNYQFELTGLRILLYPIIKYLIPKWNAATWYEDVPLKLRRQQVMRMNFRDWKGLPNKIKDRKFTGPINFNPAFRRLSKDDNKLSLHPFYNSPTKSNGITKSNGTTKSKTTVFGKTVKMEKDTDQEHLDYQSK